LYQVSWNLLIHVPMFRNVMFILCLTVAFTDLTAQKVYVVDYESRADLKVYVVEYESRADLCVYVVDYETRADEEGLWYFVEYPSRAELKVYFVEYESRADLKIFFVKYPSRAGWKNPEKQALLHSPNIAYIAGSPYLHWYDPDTHLRPAGTVYLAVSG